MQGLELCGEARGDLGAVVVRGKAAGCREVVEGEGDQGMRIESDGG
jgi:hypothetical protein